MNCKPGELAIITREPTHSRGFRDRIVRLADAPPVVVGPIGWCWRLEGHVAGKTLGFIRDVDGTILPPGTGIYATHWPDADLRPIRDQPGKDQTLAWKAVPTAPEATRSTENVFC